MKKFLTSLLCVMIVFCMMPGISFAEETESARTIGYNTSGTGHKPLPEAPVTNGNTIKVTTENAQYTLDGAYGSISGKTIVFTQGTYERLIFARPTKYEGSGTVYRHGSYNNPSMTYAEFIAYKNSPDWTEGCYYERNISNVTFTAEAGAVLEGITFETGAHVYGEIYDYVRDKGIWCHDTTDGYYHKVNISNITFDGIKFGFDGDNTLSIETTQPLTQINGITVKNCGFEGTGMDPSNKQAIRFCTWLPQEDVAVDVSKNIGNLTVANTKIDNYYQGVYASNAHDINIINNEITNTGHNAAAIQSEKYVSYGNVNIIDNTFGNIHDRVIRMGNVGMNSNFVIKNNVATNSGDSAGELVKDAGCHLGVTYEITDNKLNGNDWSSNSIKLNTVAENNLVLESTGNKVIAVSTSAACCIGNTVYNSLSDAITAAGKGSTVILLKNDESLTDGKVPEGVVLDFNGHTLSSGQWSLKVFSSIRQRIIIIALQIVMSTNLQIIRIRQ